MRITHCCIYNDAKIKDSTFILKTWASIGEKSKEHVLKSGSNDIAKIVVKKIIRVTLSRTNAFYENSLEARERRNFVCLPYLSPLLLNLLRPDLKPAFYPYLHLGRILTEGKDSNSLLAKSGVYLLKCRDHSAV